MERKVIVRSHPKWGVSLFFPEEVGDFNLDTMGCFDWDSGHGAASEGFYLDCKPITHEEAVREVVEYEHLYGDSETYRIMRRVSPETRNKRMDGCREYNRRAKESGDWGYQVHLLAPTRI